MKYRFACSHIDIPSKTIHFVADVLYDTMVSPVPAQSTRNFRLLFRPNKSGCCISIFPLSCPAKLQSKHSSQPPPTPLDPRQHYFSCCRRQGLGAPTPSAVPHPTSASSTRVGQTRTCIQTRIWSGIRQWINYVLLLLIRRPLDQQRIGSPDSCHRRTRCFGFQVALKESAHPDRSSDMSGQ